MIPSNPKAQAGRTTCQMLAAPQDSTFVWCDNRLSYPRRLASDLGRNDLTIRPLSWLSFRSVLGRLPVHVTIDHFVAAAMLNLEQLKVLNYLQSRFPRGTH